MRMPEHADTVSKRHAQRHVARGPGANQIDLSARRILALHTMAGNQAVQRLLGGPRLSQPAAAVTLMRSVSAVVQRDLSKRDADAKKKVQDLVKADKHDER